MIELLRRLRPLASLSLAYLAGPAPAILCVQPTVPPAPRPVGQCCSLARIFGGTAEDRARWHQEHERAARRVQ